MNATASDSGGTLYTMSEAARELNTSEAWLRRAFKSGRLPEPQRLGHARVITATDLDRARELLASGRGK